GFVDLGGHTPERQKHQLGDHALVIMFQSFRGKWVQTLACFLSKGCADSKNAIAKNEEIWTPDGIVKKNHWRAVLGIESKQPLNLKAAYKLTSDTLNPKLYQKMNVPLAFEYFSNRVSTAMQMFMRQDDRTKFHPDLEDCLPSVAFINRIHGIIDVMMLRSGQRALKLNSFEHEKIINFLEYLEEWETIAKEKNYIFITDSTCYGLKISLRATLELLEYLTGTHHYEYLMPNRLNQDVLERFFSMARQVCGSNNHPDSIMFGKMFHLMSTYALLKPPKGSNISRGEILDALMSDNKNNEEVQIQNGTRKGLTDMWDRLLEFLTEKSNSFFDNSSISTIIDHDQMQSVVHPSIICYMTGYLAKKCGTWTKCTACLKNIITDGSEICVRKPRYESDYKRSSTARHISLNMLRYRR
ncbi:hypothetical protein PV325_006952, partial [Microctonus aethiopoides]